MSQHEPSFTEQLAWKQGAEAILNPESHAPRPSIQELAAQVLTLLRSRVTPPPVAEGGALVFSCPACGDPSAAVNGDVDIHSGATYRCDECGAAVVFSAERAEDYSRRVLASAPPAASSGVEAERRKRVASWVRNLAAEVTEAPEQWGYRAYEMLREAEGFILSPCAAPEQPMGMGREEADALIGRYTAAVITIGSTEVAESRMALRAALMGTPAQRGEPSEDVAPSGFHWQNGWFFACNVGSGDVRVWPGTGKPSVLIDANSWESIERYRRDAMAMNKPRLEGHAVFLDFMSRWENTRAAVYAAEREALRQADMIRPWSAKEVQRLGRLDAALAAPASPEPLEGERFEGNPSGWHLDRDKPGSVSIRFSVAETTRLLASEAFRGDPHECRAVLMLSPAPEVTNG